MAYPFSTSSFSLRSLVRDLLTVHEQRSFTDFFCSGGSHTTPHLCSIDARWQFPWRSLLLMMILLAFVLAFMIFEHIARLELGNTKLLASAIFIQSVAIPLALVSLFGEINLWRNQSWLRLIAMVGGGGLLAIVFSLVLSIFDRSTSPFSAGLIEEPAKIAATLLFARAVGRRKCYVLNGLLFGSAVGAGFSIMESTGYAFEALLAPVELGRGGQLDFQQAYTVMAARSFFFITAGHVTWTAITCGALWHSMRDRSLWKALVHPHFLFFLFVAVFVHGYWNYTSSKGNIITMIPLFALISWGFVAVLIHLGIQQIREAQQLWFRRNGASKRCIWICAHSGEVEGPRTPYEIIDQVEHGNLSPQTLCAIDRPSLEPHSVSKLSFIADLRSHEAASQPPKVNWYHCARPFWFLFCRMLGIIGMVSLSFFIFAPRLMSFIYLSCCITLFFIMMSVLYRLWRSPNLPTEPVDQRGALVWADASLVTFLKFFIPFYNVYWAYVITAHLIRRVNLLHTGGRRIPIWIPQVFWTAFSTASTLVLVQLFYDYESFLPYLMISAFLYPSSAALVCVALASAENTLSTPHELADEDTYR